MHEREEMKDIQLPIPGSPHWSFPGGCHREGTNQLHIEVHVGGWLHVKIVVDVGSSSITCRNREESGAPPPSFLTCWANYYTYLLRNKPFFVWSLSILPCLAIQLYLHPSFSNLGWLLSSGVATSNPGKAIEPAQPSPIHPSHSTQLYQPDSKMLVSLWGEGAQAGDTQEPPEINWRKKQQIESYNGSRASIYINLLYGHFSSIETQFETLYELPTSSPLVLYWMSGTIIHNFIIIAILLKPRLLTFLRASPPPPISYGDLITASPVDIVRVFIHVIYL